MPLPTRVSLTPMLAALAYGEVSCRFLDRERRLLLAIMAEPTAPSAWQLAARLRRPYTHVKADVRGLLAGGSCVEMRVAVSRSSSSRPVA
jgi:hypothetical protein